MQPNESKETKSAETILNEQFLPRSSRPSWLSVKLTTVWNVTKQVCSSVFSKLSNGISAVRNQSYLDEYVYIPPENNSRLYIANEVPYELEPVLNYLAQGENGFVIEDDDGDVHSVIFNVDIMDCTKLMILFVGVNSTVLLILLVFKTLAPGFYSDMGIKLVY